HAYQLSMSYSDSMSSIWQTSKRDIGLANGPLVMGILNVTPDSFSDGGGSADDAITKAERMIADGADIIDIGGESTRPGSRQVDVETELRRTLPAITALARRFEVPLSIDTSKAVVARAALDAGAEIVNDISGLRWDRRIADIVAETGSGLILTHSRGTFETMHRLEPVEDVLKDLFLGFRSSISTAKDAGVAEEQIVLDVGIGFGKTSQQNLELLARLDRIVSEFPGFELLVGASRKSFIGNLLGGVPPDQRLAGSIAAACIAVDRGVRIVRVHDVKETVDALKIVQAIVCQ
ncbi:MAG TPA: dihydropteroate synthase, partial [Pyrinomonadaceae bacterium]|nr:dihydropteroate synthase [Pyrinomonadaceae bacterium]